MKKIDEQAVPFIDIEGSQPINNDKRVTSISDLFVEMLLDLGVELSFGISGGAIAGFWDAIMRSRMKLLHFRHESGAVFAAAEYNLTSNKPAVVVSTTGPGVVNSLTGLFAARWEGAKVIFISPATSDTQCGRFAFQETSLDSLGDLFFTAGPVFHYAVVVKEIGQLNKIACKLKEGIDKAGGFVAHISIPTNIQSLEVEARALKVDIHAVNRVLEKRVIERCVELVEEGPLAIWIGFGARKCSELIRTLAERLDAAVMCSPRAKGIFPEDHPLFVGVTGFGGHDSVTEYMKEFKPVRTLVLGTKMGEFTSFWNRDLVPQKGFIQVDIDADALATAYPDVPHYAVNSDIEPFLTNLLHELPERQTELRVRSYPNPDKDEIITEDNGKVRPEVLMDAIQRIIIEKSDAIVLTEAGNAFAWGTHSLQFTRAGRYRVSTGFGSMGHAATGVLGAAIASNNKAVAIVGDGAMLMFNEIGTAVHYKIPCVWIVLNDSGYGMIEHGMRSQGYEKLDVRFKQVDFVQYARSLGADGIRVNNESELDSALYQALEANNAFVVDIIMDETQPPPFGKRVSSLIAQGLKG